MHFLVCFCLKKEQKLKRIKGKADNHYERGTEGKLNVGKRKILRSYYLNPLTYPASLLSLVCGVGN